MEKRRTATSKDHLLDWFLEIPPFVNIYSQSFKGSRVTGNPNWASSFLDPGVSWNVETTDVRRMNGSAELSSSLLSWPLILFFLLLASERSDSRAAVSSTNGIGINA